MALKPRAEMNSGQNQEPRQNQEFQELDKERENQKISYTFSKEKDLFSARIIHGEDKARSDINYGQN